MPIATPTTGSGGERPSAIREFTGALTLATAVGSIVECVTLAEAKAHLRVDGTADDAVITGLITAARQSIDGAAGWLGRCLTTQAYVWDFDAFPSSSAALRVPLPPLLAVDTITYIDANGVEKEIEDYVVDRASEPGRIVPARGKTWPSVRSDEMFACRVNFTAGYGPAAADVPGPIKLAVKCLVAHFFEFREPFVAGPIAAIPHHVEALLAPYRLWWW